MEPQRSRGRRGDAARRHAVEGRQDLASEPGAVRDAVKPVYVKAKEKFGADVDGLLADADAVRKALPAK